MPPRGVHEGWPFQPCRLAGELLRQGTSGLGGDGPGIAAAGTRFRFRQWTILDAAIVFGTLGPLAGLAVVASWAAPGLTGAIRRRADSPMTILRMAAGSEIWWRGSEGPARPALEAAAIAFSVSGALLLRYSCGRGRENCRMVQPGSVSTANRTGAGLEDVPKLRLSLLGRLELTGPCWACRSAQQEAGRPAGLPGLHASPSRRSREARELCSGARTSTPRLGRICVRPCSGCAASWARMSWSATARQLSLAAGRDRLRRGPLRDADPRWQPGFARRGGRISTRPAAGRRNDPGGRLVGVGSRRAATAGRSRARCLIRLAEQKLADGQRGAALKAAQRGDRHQRPARGRASAHHPRAGRRVDAGRTR